LEFPKDNKLEFIESDFDKFNYDKKTHLSGPLNNLVPVVLQEMKNNQEFSKEYMEFLNDNDIKDYRINIFNFIAQYNDIDYIDDCLDCNIKF
jgi:hypothetical protein